MKAVAAAVAGMSQELLLNWKRTEVTPSSLTELMRW